MPALEKIPGVRTNLTGLRAGWLTVTGFAERRNYGNGLWINVWNCLCDCGNTCQRVQVQLLNPSPLTSCGCQRTTVQQQRKNYGFGSVNGLMCGHRIRAKKAGRAFTLTVEEFRELTSSNCYYCGVEPYQVITNGKCAPYVYNGLDRVDNNGGYTTGNVRTCCGICNMAKSDWSEQEFYAWMARIEKVGRHRGK